MYKYTLRRLLLAAPVLLLSSLIVFGLMRVMPGDALTALMGESGNIGEKELQKIRHDLRLDLPYHEQYLLWLWQMVSLRPGDSIFTGEPITASLAKAAPVTLELAALAMLLGLVVAVPIGVLSATRQDTAADYVGRMVAVSGLSLPDFWLATLVITFAAIWFHWIPAIGYVSFWDSPWRNLQQFLLPAAVLGFRLASATMRMTRSTVLEVLREDYVRTAWAKGLAGRIVVYKHALKNALIPVVTIVGGQMGTLLAGTVIVETIFALPGMGRLTVETEETISRLRALWNVMRKKPLGMASALLLLVLVLTAIFADVLAPYDPLETHPEIRLQAPSRAHLFGTDDIGRDVLSRVVYGSRISLWVGLLAVGIGTFAGMIIGLACGYWEGRLDIVLQRVMDAIQAIPGLVLALAIVSVLKPSTTNAMLAIAIVIIPGNSRIVRGAVLSAKQNRYVEAAQALGCKQLKIVLTHILPNVTAPILVIASIWLGNAILIEASLSFLGLGTQPPIPSWGLMLSSTGRAFMEQAPWLAIFPGLAISLAVFGFNLFGDTLRDAWDPKLRRRG